MSCTVSDATSITQAVFLQPSKGNPKISSSSPSLSPPSSSKSVDENTSSMVESLQNENEIDKNDNVDTKEASEGLKSVINFLKERIPGFKVKVVNDNDSDGTKMDGEALEQLVQEETASSENLEDKPSNIDNSKSDAVPVGQANDITDDDENIKVKLYIGGILHNREDFLSKAYVRHLAKIKDVEKDSFTLHIPGRKSVSGAEVISKESKARVSAIAAHAASDLMPPDVAKAFWNVDKAPSKVMKKSLKFFCFIGSLFFSVVSCFCRSLGCCGFCLQNLFYIFLFISSIQ